MGFSFREMAVGGYDTSDVHDDFEVAASSTSVPLLFVSHYHLQALRKKSES